VLLQVQIVAGLSPDEKKKALDILIEVNTTERLAVTSSRSPVLLRGKPGQTCVWAVNQWNGAVNQSNTAVNQSDRAVNQSDRAVNQSNRAVNQSNDSLVIVSDRL
jgi:uncharacterized protein YukE